MSSSTGFPMIVPVSVGNKTLLLVNGFMARRGLRKARRAAA
jgi:hypothetical protein